VKAQIPAVVVLLSAGVVVAADESREVKAFVGRLSGEPQFCSTRYGGFTRARRTPFREASLRPASPTIACEALRWPINSGRSRSSTEA
jgi:hypothetical protein